MRAHDVAERIERTNVLRVLGDDFFEQHLGVVHPLERIQRQRLLNLDVQPERRILFDVVEGGELEIVSLGAIIGFGERDLGEREVRLKVESELQEDDAHVEAALAGESIADAVKHLGQAVVRRGDEQRRSLAGLDVGQAAPSTGDVAPTWRYGS